MLEWDPVELATAEFRSLSLYRNGTKAGNIPRDKLSTKISGLALDTEYTFHLVLRTSAGQYSSDKVAIKTHKMTDLHGITITPGVIPGQLKESLAETVNRIGAKLIDTVRIDTTHFVCTEPRGQAWEKAVEMNVPIVVPDWLKGCEREGRIVGVRGYYLDADPKLRQMGPSTHQQRGSVSSASVPMRDSPRIEHTPPTPERPTHPRQEEGDERASTSSAAQAPAPPSKVSDDTLQEQNAHGNHTSTKQIDGNDTEEDETSEDDEAADDPEKSDVREKNVERDPKPASSKAPPTPGEEGNFSEVEL